MPQLDVWHCSLCTEKVIQFHLFPFYYIRLKNQYTASRSLLTKVSVFFLIAETFALFAGNANTVISARSVNCTLCNKVDNSLHFSCYIYLPEAVKLLLLLSGSPVIASGNALSIGEQTEYERCILLIDK